jgi:DNA polymerase-3 subunit beta
MAYEINQQALNETLKALKRNLDGRPSHPVLEGFLLEFKGLDLKISAVAGTGFEQKFARAAATVGLNAGNGRDLSIAIPGKELADFVATLPKGCDVVLSSQPDNSLRIEADRISTTILGNSPEDFPTVFDSGTDTKGAQVSIPATSVAAVLKDTLYSASKDSAKIALSSVSFTVEENGTLTAVATDGHRMSYIETHVGNQASGLKLEVPLKIANQLQKLLGSNLKKLAGKDVKFYQTGKDLLGISYDSMEFTFSATSCKYPDCAQLIPDKFSMATLFYTEELTRALTRASKFANTGNGVVKFEFDLDAGSSSLSCENFKETLSVCIEGSIEGNKIGFNVNYLLDALKGPYLKNSKLVSMEMNSPTSSAVLEPCPSTVSDFYRYLLMPVRIRS